GESGRTILCCAAWVEMMWQVAGARARFPGSESRGDGVHEQPEEAPAYGVCAREGDLARPCGSDGTRRMTDRYATDGGDARSLLVRTVLDLRAGSGKFVRQTLLLAASWHRHARSCAGLEVLTIGAAGAGLEDF